MAQTFRHGTLERETMVASEEGLHARPAARFVDTAKHYLSEIVVAKYGQEVNTKSSLRLMTLGARKGDRRVIRAEGDDAGGCGCVRQAYLHRIGFR